MKFKIGDLARVKFGVPESCQDDGVVPYSCSYGKKLTITDVDTSPCNTVQFTREIDRVRDYCNSRHLEPWNDKEYWDGQKWVANPSCEPVPVIPDSVWVGGVEYVRKVDGPMMKLTMAQEYAANIVREHERINKWEWCSKKTAKTNVVSATANGDLVTIVERVISME